MRLLSKENEETGQTSPIDSIHSTEESQNHKCKQKIYKKQSSDGTLSWLENTHLIMAVMCFTEWKKYIVYAFQIMLCCWQFIKVDVVAIYDVLL